MNADKKTTCLSAFDGDGGRRVKHQSHAGGSSGSRWPAIAASTSFAKSGSIAAVDLAGIRAMHSEMVRRTGAAARMAARSRTESSSPMSGVSTFCWYLSWASAPEGREKELHFAGNFHGHQPRRGARKNYILLVTFMGISPGGARESSPWREPWEQTRTARSPGEAKEPFHGDSPIAGHEGPSYAPTGLARLWAGPTGLTPWAIF